MHTVVAFFGETNRETFVLENHQPVAQFTFEGLQDVEDVLEVAYFHTQNLHGSWSLAGSSDSHVSLGLIQSRPVFDGQEYGHRSSMVGDRFVVTFDTGEQKIYEVANCGFKRID